MTFVIDRLDAVEVLDSRGRPTVRVFCDIGGERGWATAPSGASTGRHKAWERRDGDSAWYAGSGCRGAVRAVVDEIAGATVGEPFTKQRALDDRLRELDGTPNLSRLGANAALAVSIAVATTVAKAHRVELFDHVATFPSSQPQPRLPRPMINLFSGGRHAGGQVAVQDLLVVPLADRIDEAMHQTERVYAAAAQLILRKYGMRELTADEGGLAPDFSSCADLFADAAEAVEAAGLDLGRDIAFAVDVAASEFFVDGGYHIDGELRTESELIDTIVAWCEDYPIISIEDGLAEDAWEGWSRLRAALADDVILIGDDLLCTNVDRVGRAVTEKAADGLLLKVNQTGTLSAAADALDTARDAGWSVTVSARSGETEDRWLADLAMGWAGDYIKVGSIRQSERLAKYNRLLEIAAGIRSYPAVS